MEATISEEPASTSSASHDSDSSPQKIKISVTEEGIPVVWDAKDWMILREKHRIIGSLVGLSVAHPFNEGASGLPMLLQPWETTVLLVDEIAELVYYPSLTSPPSDFIKELFGSYRETIMKEQIDCLVEERKEEVTQKLETISEGKQQKQLNPPKRRKLLIDSKRKKDECEPSTSAHGSAEVDKSSVLQEELSKIKEPPPECTMIQTFTRTPWLGKGDEKEVQWRYPSNPRETLLFCVFEDFWRKGLYVTSGEKFGGDFLVYPGDPCKFHAHFLVLCVEENTTIKPTEMVSMCRLGNSIHKTVLYAFIMNDKVVYQSVNWLPMKNNPDSDDDDDEKKDKNNDEDNDKDKDEDNDKDKDEDNDKDKDEDNDKDNDDDDDEDGEDDAGDDDDGDDDDCEDGDDDYDDAKDS